MSEQINMVLSLGQLLKNAREQKDLSQDDIADYLRLDKGIIVKIENDEYAQNQLSVFISGYIRSYAKYVQISAEEIESYFLGMGVIQESQPVKHLKFAIGEEINKARPIKAITYSIIGLLIVLA